MLMRMKEKEDQDEDEEGSLAIWDCGSPLYDSYELVSLGHLLDRHVMVLPSLHDAGSRICAPSLKPGSKVAPIRHNHISSSAAACGFSQIVGWKRRNEAGERKDRAKKLKTGLHVFYSKVGFFMKLKFKSK